MAPPSLTLTRRQAQHVALSAGAGLARSRRRGPAAVEELVRRIGFVQIDTISVVHRAHHHILAARLPGYTTDWLDGADVLEYWAHAAAYLPWCDYRYTLPRKQRIKANGHDWFRADRDAVDLVLARIRSEGPLRARDFEHRETRAGWWDWKPAKRALEYLFMAGELMVSRQGFQKVFDLTERVLPPEIDARMPSAEEQGAWYVDRALDTWGIVARDEFGYLRKECIGEIGGVLAAREEDGTLQRVTVEGIPKVVYWVRPEDLVRLDRRRSTDSALHILSPFDPLLIHRKRIARLFGFDFAIECYLPAAKRQFGYFALPLFWHGGFVGLVDAKADRAVGVLEVRKLRYDGPANQRARFDAALGEALQEFARFNGVAVVKRLDRS